MGSPRADADWAEAVWPGPLDSKTMSLRPHVRVLPGFPASGRCRQRREGVEAEGAEVSASGSRGPCSLSSHGVPTAVPQPFGSNTATQHPLLLDTFRPSGYKEKSDQITHVPPDAGPSELTPLREPDSPA